VSVIAVLLSWIASGSELLDPSQILNLVGQLGGDHEQAGQLLGGLLGQGGQVDTEQHGGLLQQLGINSQQLDQFISVSASG
jgi:hypothetical protein